MVDPITTADGERIMTDEDRAVEALAQVMRLSLSLSAAGYARACIAAIRAGKVPTIYHISQIPGVREYAARHDADVAHINSLKAERDQLRAEVERLRIDRDKCQRNEDEVGDRLEKAEARLADYDKRLTAVMSPDLKCWHQNSRDEWPEVAAWVITNLRERAETASAPVRVKLPDGNPYPVHGAAAYYSRQQVIDMLKEQGVEVAP